MDEIWYGLKPDGSPVSITHKKLMEWAYDHDAQFQVGWSHHYKMADGTRLARRHEAAAEAKWTDLADMMKAQGLP